MNTREAYVALNMIPGIGPVRVRAMREALGSAVAILEASASQLERVPGIGPEVAQQVADWRESVDLDGELKRIAAAGITVVTCEDDDYPPLLREIYDPPLVLYVRGTLCPGEKRAFAIVGSRRTTLYGQEMARRLAFQLVRGGATVVSGLARGIDTQAHRGALQAGGRTVAVLGCGIDQVYPPENADLAREIVEKGGAVVTEFPFGTRPDRQRFPMRNRLVSGWALGVVVVEANLTSGALITARMAAEQGRQVFAVPGRVDSVLSRGCHRLIKDGAKLTEDAEDVWAEFEYLVRPTDSDKGSLPARFPLRIVLNEWEQKIVAAIGEDEPAVDEIVRATGLTTALVSATLLGLEMKRVVRKLPGQRYARNPALVASHG